MGRSRKIIGKARGSCSCEKRLELAGGSGSLDDVGGMGRNGKEHRGGGGNEGLEQLHGVVPYSLAAAHCCRTAHWIY